jgi:hypothetical protein
VFILKVVKVLCFDTLLQVLILNEIEEASGVDGKWGTAGCRNRETPTRVCHPRCFAKRVRKLLKTKDDDRKKRGKRFQEAASS